MKKLFLVICALSMFGLSIFGQTSKSDLEQLRKEIGLPYSVSIFKNDASFPDLKPIKIFLAIKHNKDASKNFINWVGKWNRTNGNQYGQLQIVDNIADADIAAVQYQFGSTHFVREESVQAKIGKVPTQVEKNDRFVLNRVGNSKIKVESSDRALRIPLYTYLITRSQGSSWYVNYSRVDELISEENQFPEVRLQSTIESRLKNR